jgi:hypothetical protein
MSLHRYNMIQVIKASICQSSLQEYISTSCISCEIKRKKIESRLRFDTKRILVLDEMRVRCNNKLYVQDISCVPVVLESPLKILSPLHSLLLPSLSFHFHLLVILYSLVSYFFLSSLSPSQSTQTAKPWLLHSAYMPIS